MADCGRTVASGRIPTDISELGEKMAHGHICKQFDTQNRLASKIQAIRSRIDTQHDYISRS